MTAASLLFRPDNERSLDAFTFDHAMAHRNYYQVMAPLHGWSVLPYFIDPGPNAQTGARAGPWQLNHQRAHDDFRVALPSDWNSPNQGIPTRQVLVDSDLNDKGSEVWWTFANHQEHYVANATVLPALPLAQTEIVNGMLVVLPPPWISTSRWTLPPFW